MNQQQLINRIQRSAQQFISYMERLQEDGYFAMQFNNNWTVRDVLAHILWYEEEMVLLLNQQSLSQASTHWDNPYDRRNALIQEEMQGISPADLFSRHDEAVQQICQLIADLDPLVLDDPTYFEAMPADWVPWQILAQNTYEHYEDHLHRLQQFVKEQDV